MFSVMQHILNNPYPDFIDFSKDKRMGETFLINV